MAIPVLVSISIIPLKSIAIFKYLGHNHFVYYYNIRKVNQRFSIRCYMNDDFLPQNCFPHKLVI